MRRVPRSILLLATACATACAMGAAGCAPPADRAIKQRVLQRWEDRRLADADSMSALLRDDDAHVRLAAMRAAGRIGRTGVLTELIAGLTDASPTIRAAAAEALGLVGDASAAGPLIGALAGNGPEVRRSVLFALARVRNDGAALMTVARDGTRDEAALAWNALRDRAADADTTALADAIRGGLERPEVDVLWRVLRCAEKVPVPSLAADVAPFAHHLDAQVRVHACRALAALGGPTAFAGLVAGGEDPGRFTQRDRARIDIARLRGFGRLGAAALRDSADAQPLVGQLGEGARSSNPHVARTALEAMAQIAGDAPLPVEARLRDSLLPVWRLRLLQAAQAGCAPSVTEPVVRAAAVRACVALRGAGVQDLPFWPALAADTHPLVQEAVWDALVRHALDPDQIAARCGDLATAPPRLQLVALEALPAALDRIRQESHTPEAKARAGEAVESALRRAALGHDPYASASACGLLGGYPSARNLGVLTRAWARADGLAGVDVRRGVLQALTTFAADTSFAVPDSLRARTVALLEQGFDHDRLQVRSEARAAAAALMLTAPALIPSEASLLETMPAAVRDPGQTTAALPDKAPRLLCTTPRGTFTIALETGAAPRTCASFVQLTREGFFAGGTFHRVVPDFVIQGGDPGGTGWGGPGYTLRSEWSSLPFVRGTVGVAHSGKDTEGSQFFVCLSPQPHLDGRYTVFGRVVGGMEVAEKVQPDDQFTLSIIE